MIILTLIVVSVAPYERDPALSKTEIFSSPAHTKTKVINCSALKDSAITISATTAGEHEHCLSILIGLIKDN